MKTMGYKDYLAKKGLQPTTIKCYANYLEKHYFTYFKKKSLAIEKVKYTDLLAYVNHLQEKDFSVNYINHILSAVRHYYNYLKTTKEVTKNPAAELFIKGAVRRIPHDLFSTEKLEEIYTGFNQRGIAGKRNKILLGLIIYQGLNTAELSLLESLHLRLREGKIDVPGTTQKNRRTLKLEAHQMIDLQEYQSKTRDLILAITEKETARLFTSMGSSYNLANTLYKITKTLKDQHTDFKNLQQLRQSRIAIWTKQHDIRQAQYLAGHKYVSSTERYQNTHMDDLQKELDKHHPLND
ncbi:MAG: site-specific integrase [Candidatus Saccharimonadales bacterium]